MIAERAVKTGTNLYVVAGWLSIFQAMLILPKVGADLFAEQLSLTGAGIMQLFVGFHVIDLILGIYILLKFKHLLNERHSFHATDLFIKMLITCNIAGALFGATDLLLGYNTDIIVALPIIWAVSSLIEIVFAVKLLKLESNLSGLLKPFVYTTIAASALGVTIVLGEFGRPLSMVSLILLGMILLRAESDPEYL